MPRALSQRLLRLAGILAVVAILGFLVLPAVVVTLAAFNSRAILSFPPETWSLRWFVKALAYEDFQAGFRNGPSSPPGPPPSRWPSAPPSPSRSTATSSASSAASRRCCCRRW